MRKGGIPLLHASTYKFRKEEKHKHIDYKRFLVKNSETAFERANRMERKYKESFYRLGYYEDELPFKSNNWLREENKGKWVGSNFRYRVRTENERINKTLDYNASTYDYAHRKLKMI